MVASLANADTWPEAFDWLSALGGAADLRRAVRSARAGSRVAALAAATASQIVRGMSTGRAFPPGNAVRRAIGWGGGG